MLDFLQVPHRPSPQPVGIGAACLRSMRWMLTCGLAIVVGVAASASTVHADGLVRDGIGAISNGRGGTNIAHSDNATVILDNPAGILNAPGRGFVEFGIDTLITDIDYRDPQNNVEAEFGAVPSPSFGITRVSDDGNWAVGIGVFTPAGFGAEFNMFHPIMGFQDYRSLGILTKILPTAAVKVTDRLTVGATLGVGINHVELEGPQFIQTGFLRGTPTVFDLKANGAGMVWSLGLQYQLSDNTTLGASYTSESDFTLEGQLDVDIYGLGPQPVRSKFDAEVEIAYPQSFGAGIVHRIGCQHRVSADVIWYDWSRSFNDVDFKLTNASNPLLAALLPSTVRDASRLDWKDGISVRLGYEYFHNNGDIYRLGYVHHPNPSPDSTLNTYTDGILQHGLSIGHSTNISEWTLSTSYQYQFSLEESVGQSEIVGGDFSNSEYRVQAHWLGISLLRRF